MKKSIYTKASAAFAILLSAMACNKAEEITAPDNDLNVEKEITIQASIVPMTSDGTKTTYNFNGSTAEFSWKNGDQASVLIYPSADIYDGETLKYYKDQMNNYTITASADGPDVSFSGSIGSGWEDVGYALYPIAGTGWTYNKFADVADGVKVTLYGTAYNRNSTAPEANIPMIGTKQLDGSYSFHAAMGVLVFTITNLPLDTRRFYIRSSSTSRHLQGTYTLEDDLVYMKNWVGETDSYPDRYINYTPSEIGETVEFYVPVPIGTLPANSYIALLNNSYEIIKYKIMKKDVESKANTLSIISPVTFAIDPSEVIGTYIGTAYSEHGGASVDDMTIVIAASDNPSLGNIKITQIGDIAGTAYGWYDGYSRIRISRGQVFSNFAENANGYDRYSLLGLNYPSYYWSSNIEFLISGNTLTLAWADSSDTTNAYWLVLRETNESTWTADPTNGRGWSYGRCWRSLSLTKQVVAPAPPAPGTTSNYQDGGTLTW